MNNKHWGMLVARALSIWAMVQGIAVLLAQIDLWRNIDASGDTHVSRVPSIVLVALHLVVAVLLWSFADRFSPSAIEKEATGDSKPIATVLVAMGSAYLALTYLHGLLTELLAHDHGARLEIGTVISGAVTVACVLATIFAGRVVGWLSR